MGRILARREAPDSTAKSLSARGQSSWRDPALKCRAIFVRIAGEDSALLLQNALCVDYCCNHNFGTLQLVNDPITVREDFTNVFIIEFRDLST